MDQNSLLQAVIPLAEQAGEKIMEVYRSGDFETVSKSDDSPLTIADKLSHQVISQGLRHLDVGPILSEESVLPAWGERQNWGVYWLIDPLDGTKEFIKKTGEFTVNIALIEDGKPILGVVYVPATGVLYFAASEVGAFKKDVDGTTTAIKTAPLLPDMNGWKIVGSLSHTSPEFDQYIAKFIEPNIVCMGSSLKLCLVAEGAADLYPRLGLTSEWDTAAAQAVVECAGGAVISLETGKFLKYNTKESLLNPYFIVVSKWESTQPEFNNFLLN